MRRRKAASYRQGVDAEGLAAAALEQDGWAVLARRLRTKAGEIDIVAERDGVLAIVEVKQRPSLDAAAWALGPRQQARLIRAAEIFLGENPALGRAGVRFDVILVDAAGSVRRITDAFREE